MSRASHHFSQAPQANVPRSVFNRSHAYKTTFDAGYLIPIFCDEILPGDTFNLKMTGFSRLATPFYPIMDNLFMETFFFFVPNRLIWDNWKKFNGERKNPNDQIDYVVPVLKPAPDGLQSGSIYDYFGLPVAEADATPLPKNLKDIIALPFRAYNLIYNEWFRDQNMIDSIPVPTGDGPDDLDTNYLLRRRGKRYDYFTSCLPWPQKGPSVCLPLGDQAQIKAKSKDKIYMDTDGDNTDRILAYNSKGSGATEQNFYLRNYNVTGNFDVHFKDPVPLYADLTTATATCINSLRQAFQIQKLYERDARGGTRYTEIIQSHFGVVSPDARQQRPEYLGGGSSPVIVNPIAQTSAVEGQPSPLGNLAAYGTCALHDHGFTKSFTEHGYVIGLVSVRADLTYQKGIERYWSRKTRFDFYWPVLSHLGEQAVLNKEIYAQGTDDDEKVFGYQERYAEYRYKPALITGKFRSVVKSSLDPWHLSQDFKSLPTLSKDFIEENPPMSRIEAVPTQPDFIFDSWFSLRCARPMPTYSVPGLVDHF
nr:MAG: major capsid protein [Army ant associated microvirus 2]